MDNLLVILIVGLAVAYLFKTFYKKFGKGQKMDCGCGCDACQTDPMDCESIQERTTDAP